MHYRRWQRHGDVDANARPEMVIGTPEERFWPKVDRRSDDECWEWQGWRLPRGYGHFGKGGREGGTMLTHRFAYELANGPIPAGMTIDHICNNPPCVNVRHLQAVSQKVNNNRSDTVRFKVNAAKTHCPKGHEYTPENTYQRLRKDGGYSRQCRACTNEAVRRGKAKRRANNA